MKPLPKQRKPKKVVPIGANGLKKKRVVKTRSKTDEKGYQGEFSSTLEVRCCGLMRRACQ